MVLPKPQRIIPLLLIIIFLLFPFFRSIEQMRLMPLKRTLFTQNDRRRYGLTIPEDDQRFKAIKLLQKRGTYTAVSILRDFLTDNSMNRKLKQHALVALGQIGTKSAVKAIKSFESWSQKRFLEQQNFRFGFQEYAIDHFSPYEIRPLTQTIDDKNNTWALFISNRYLRDDLWLTCSKDEKLWSPPVLIDHPEMPQPTRLPNGSWNTEYKLKVKDDFIIIDCNNYVIESRLSDYLIDDDKDGLPNIVETRLFTEPNNPNSDKDGLPDGKDCNPLTAKHDKINDITEISQAIFSILFATCSSQNTIIIVDRGAFAKQEYYGYSGFILHLTEPKMGFVNITAIDVKLESPNTASGLIRDWEAGSAASTHEAKLKKIHGKWVVIEFKMTVIS